MKTIKERTAWMDKFEGTIPVGEGRSFVEGGKVYTPETWVNSHLRRPEDTKVTAEDVKSLGEFKCKLIWTVNCKYGVIPDSEDTTYTNALLEVLGFSSTTTEGQSTPKHTLHTASYEVRDTLLVR